MSILNKLSESASQLGDTLASIVKIMLLSRRATVKPIAADTDELIILGNGPSLNTTIAEHLPFLEKRKKLAVNFAANTDLFTRLRPDFYVLADPHFFSIGSDDNVQRLWTNLKNVDWPMTLFVPTSVTLPSDYDNPRLTVQRYNLTPVEGFKGFRHAVYHHMLGMPRPRNVLIPSLMLAIATGFRTIYVAGADHSWMKTLTVDDDNRVVSVQPHFYSDNDKEKTRVRTEYANYPLHQIVYSFYVAFRSYHTIQAYAVSRGAQILNITPGSFIDAFPRKKL